MLNVLTKAAIKFTQFTMHSQKLLAEMDANNFCIFKAMILTMKVNWSHWSYPIQNACGWLLCAFTFAWHGFILFIAFKSYAIIA